MKIIKEIYTFVLDPFYDIEKHQTIKKIILSIIIILLLDLIISYAFGSILTKTGLDRRIFGNDENLEPSNYLIFSIIILGIVEELIFRAPLKYKTSTLPFLFFILFVGLLAILRNGLEIENTFSKIAVFLIPLLVVIPLYFFIRKNDINNKLRFFWKKRFRYIFYGSAILFTLIHSMEFNIVSMVTFFSALLFMVPQFISSLLLGFARMKIGLWAAIFIHIMFNIGIDYVWDFFDYLFF